MNLAYIGLHKLRVVPVEPLLIYIRFVGDLAMVEARMLLVFVLQRIHNCDARFLIDATDLGDICPDSRRELCSGGRELGARRGQLLDIVIVGASIRKKVVFSQILTTAELPGEAHGQTQFFESLGEALNWLGLPRTLLERGPGAPFPF